MDTALFQQGVEVRDLAKQWGLTAQVAGLEKILREMVRLEMVAVIQKLSPPPTTVPDTTFAPTEAHHSAVPEPVLTSQRTAASSQLAPYGMENGLAVHASWCVQPPWVSGFTVRAGGLLNGVPCSVWLECPSCHASWLLDRTPAPPVQQPSSTSQKPDSKPSGSGLSREWV